MTRGRNIISLSLLTAIGMAGLVSPSASAAASKDVLKLVPADAWGFVVIRSLEAVDQRAAQLKAALGLGIPSPVTPMALGMLNLGDAIDMTRPLCLIVLDVQKFGVPGFWSSGVLLVPAKDPQAVIQKLSPPPAEETGEQAQEKGSDPSVPKKGKASAEGIQTISLMGQESYAAIKGKYLIIGQNKDCVTKVLKTKKTLRDGFAEARSAVLGKSDIYISISLRSILTAYKDMVMMPLQMMTSAFDPEGKSVEQLIDMLMQMKAMDIAASLDEEGLALSYLVVPKDDSDLEKMLRDTKNASGSLLSVLPKEKYLAAYGATAGNSEYAEKFGEKNVLATLLNAAQIEGMDEKAIKTLDGEMLKLVKSVKSMALSVSALPAGSDGLIGMIFAVETGDAKAFLEGMRTMYKTIWTVSDDEDFQTVKENVIHAEDAETVAGHKVDTITVKLPGLAELFEIEKDDLKAAQAVVGKECAFRFGVVDKKHFLCAFGGGRARFEKAAKALTSSSGASLADDNGIGSLSKKLHSPRSSEGYVAVDNIAHVAKAIAKAVGHEDEVPFELPTLNAPVVFGVAQIGSVQQGDLYVPMKLITAIKTAFEEMTKAEMKDFDEDEDEDEDSDGDEDNDGDDAETGGH